LPFRPSPLAALAALILAACAGDPTTPAPVTSIVSVVPVGGATNVDPAAPVAITFSHPMQAGMEQYAALHEGSLAGPVVAGTWSWSADRTQLTFAPDQPLRSRTTYVLHVGGGMRDAMGGGIDYEHCLAEHGGEWATDAMLGHGPGMGGGMMGDATMMGPGWRHANGTYGMVFTFTTA
jgi:hypothetical protein